MSLCRQKPDSIVAIQGYTIYRRDRDWAETEKRKKGRVAVYVRENLKVLNVNHQRSFEMLSVELLLPSGHHMLITRLYHPPSFQYDEGDLIDTIIDGCDTFLYMHPNGVVLCGGDLNQIYLDCLSTSSGLVPIVNFHTRGTSILDNCLTNHPELFNDPLHFQRLIKTDHWGVILPPGNKIKPIRSKCCFRDFREHHKIKFTSELEDFDWISVINALDVEIATSILNMELHNLMDKCFPVRRDVMSSRDPPWITPLVKYLLRKKRAANKGHVQKVEDFSSKLYKLIGENRKTWGKNGAQGSLHWWRRVDKITLRKEKLQPCLEKEFVAGLNDYFGDLCNDKNYVKPVPLRVNPKIQAPPELQEFDVMMALSKIKKKRYWP